jgi:hypothetical protein
MLKPLALVLVLAFAAGACGDVRHPTDDAGSDDTDAAPASPAPGQDLTSAAGRVSGGRWIVDVEVGSHPVSL